MKNLISAKSCKLDEGCTLEPKHGRAEFVFDEFPKNGSQILIEGKRISGNGKFLINEKEFVFNSKKYNLIELPYSKKIIISRPKDSLGEIYISNIQCTIELEADLNKWKNILNQCDDYHCIRIIENKLFASQGGYISNADLFETIETHPSNLSVVEDNKIKFISSCQITNLILKQMNIKKTSTPYVHCPDPWPPLTSLMEKPNNILSEPAVINNPMQVANLDNHVVYDSKIVHEFNTSKTSSNQIKFIRSNHTDYLILKKGGIYNIPISALQSNNEYVVAIMAKRLNGNGKLNVGITSSKIANTTFQVLVDGEMGEKFISLHAGDKPPEKESYRLTLEMNENSSGEILISRIKIIQGFQIGQRPTLISYGESLKLPDNFVELSNAEDKISSISLKHALLPKEEPILPIICNVSATIAVSNFSAAQWANKIVPYFPNLKIKNGSVGIYDSCSNKEPDLCLGSLGSIVPAKRIWLEEFSNFSPTTKDIEIISKAEVIMSPSLPNIQLLRSKFKNKSVLVPRLWPMLPIAPLASRKPYFVYFEKHPIMTEMLKQSWSDNDPQLFVVGSKTTLPSHIKHISPYEPYSSVLSLLYGAQGVIDLSPNNHYFSSIIEIAHLHGINILSNNHWRYFTKPSIIHITSTRFERGILIPNLGELLSGIKKIANSPRTVNKIENMNFMEPNIKALLGAS